MYSTLGISKEVFAFGTKIEEELKERFAKIDEIAEYNQLKVIHAMQASKVSEACLYGTTGYGYNDLGRDTLEQVYATCFGTEDALVRPQIACGTHALATALSGNLRPGDELLSPVGKPYDTLEEVIGIRPSVGSLAEYGVTYRQVDLKEDGSFDYEGIKNAYVPAGAYHGSGHVLPAVGLLVSDNIRVGGNEAGGVVMADQKLEASQAHAIFFSTLVAASPPRPWDAHAKVNGGVVPGRALSGSQQSSVQVAAEESWGIG